MDNTTLHTFLYHCPAALRSLVLFGSWDNFSRPYSLEPDARRGRDYWRGCFTFSDIICDGNPDDLVRRDGPLKMGGTYWYYYKIDDDDETHNSSEPSTTFCPLLPGQRLNVLEVPSEGHSRSGSDPSGGFTRNPRDRYLNPVPPAPLKPSHSDIPNNISSPLPLPSPWAPKSATYPPSDAFLTPNVVRHARSASASPRMPSTPLLSDFRGLKDKLASKRSASRSRSSSKSQELEIGSPMLISTTVDEINLIPLASYRPAPTSAARDTALSTSLAARSIPTIRKEFSPLGSHPVDPVHDGLFHRTDPTLKRTASMRRRRSHVPSTIVTSEFKLGEGRMRANSADTRRTQHYLFSNSPWLSTPKYQEIFELDAQDSKKCSAPAPLLQRPLVQLAPPIADARPTSSHGGSQSLNLRQAPLNKDLPELPRYLTPAPLFACNDTSPVELPTEVPFIEEQEVLQDDEDDEILDDLIMQYQDKPNSHFSTWSSDTMGYTYSTSDDEIANSPTFSAITSDCSDLGSPQRFSRLEQTPEIEETIPSLDEDVTTAEKATAVPYLSTTPPKLDDLRISSFSSDLFNLDIQHADAAPRRQAACFGLGFQYSLPEDDTTSKATITQLTLRPEPNVQRESSLSQLNGLIDDFAYLSDAVI
ncbi:hypothetical protein DE146DRAFT_409290 [Phaeosphaeria sp. MPI-PUGE-AT-0046c]|nr:hypothetical protein DE146DRAFT_409290 [Phaeosphaeria sp. MPI-PUGE-AT-0046c]